MPVPVPGAEALETPEPVKVNVNAEPQGDAGIDEEGNLDSMGRPLPTDELFVKDAFLVFRALCKLSMKPLLSER